MTDCPCACHAHPGASCTIDAGHSENGVTYCGPHPNQNDCVLPHPKDTAPERFNGLLCRRHYHWIGNALDELANLWAVRHLVIDQHGHSDVHVQTSSVHSPAPGNMSFAALTDRRAGSPTDLEEGDVPNVPQSLQSWVHLVFVERDIDPPRPVRAIAGPACVNCVHTSCNHIRKLASNATFTIGEWTWRGGFWCLPDDVASLVRILKRERHWIAAQDWVDDFANELMTLHRLVASAAGDTMWAKPVGHCVNCGGPLFIDIGVDSITCKRCKAAWSGVHYLRLRLMLEGQGAR